MIQENCVSDCKFCVIHEYGVYVVTISGVLIFLLVIKIYWSDVISSCTGKSRPIFPPDYSPQVPTSPSMIPSFPQTTTPVYAQPPPVLVAQPVGPYVITAPQSPLDEPKVLPPPFNKRSFSKKPKRSRGRGVKKTVNKPETPSPASPDPFKLPTPDPRDVIADNESTGSNYYKQMMKGKKPVLSISQYLENKRKKVKDDPKKDKHHTKKDKK